MTPSRPGTLSSENIKLMKRALEYVVEAQELAELAVVRALNEGGAVRQVAEATGLSTTTVQKNGRKHGWPSAERRKTMRFERDPKEVFDERTRAIQVHSDAVAEVVKRDRH
jgi:uncharacterized protein YerC